MYKKTQVDYAKEDMARNIARDPNYLQKLRIRMEQNQREIVQEMPHLLGKSGCKCIICRDYPDFYKKSRVAFTQSINELDPFCPVEDYTTSEFT